VHDLVKMSLLRYISKLIWFFLQNSSTETLTLQVWTLYRNGKLRTRDISLLLVLVEYVYSGRYSIKYSNIKLLDSSSTRFQFILVAFELDLV